MKVFIITEGSKNIGFGHITRCMSLYQVFEEKGILPEFIVNGDGNVEWFLKGKNYHVFDWLENEEKLFDLVSGADIGVVDSYMASFELYKHFSGFFKVSVYIDDNKRLDYPRGMVVNIGIYAKELKYPEKRGVIYLLGSQYATLRKEFWRIPKKEIKNTVRNIMLTFGGDDARNMSSKLLSFLNELYPELRKNVVVGPGFQNIEEIEEVKNERTKLIYYPDAKGMKSVMLDSDLAISGGGQTTYELAATGTPTIGICVANNQELNLKAWAEVGFLKYAGWYDDNSFLLKKVKDYIGELNDYEARKYASEIGKKCVDGLGSKRIVNKIIEVLTNEKN